MSSHLHHWAVNIPVAVFFATMPFWIEAIENYGWFMTHFVIPTGSALVIFYQIRWSRKKRLGGKDH